MNQTNKVKLVSHKGKKIRHSIKHSKENALEENQQEELMRAVDRIGVKNEITRLRYRVFISLLMHGGLRISEAVQCRSSWITVTQDGITINIPKKDRDIRNKKRDWQPKTSAGAREVLFLAPLIGSMVNTYFISNPDGLGFTRQHGSRIVKQLGEMIGKAQLHPHALRSTYANNLIYKGVNTTTLQYYLGWANLATAENYIRTSKIAARTDLLKKHREVTKD